MLPDELRERADRLASRDGRSFAAVVREALETYLDGAEPDELDAEAHGRFMREFNARIDAMEIPDDAPTDGALNYKHYLYGAPKKAMP